MPLPGDKQSISGLLTKTLECVLHVSISCRPTIPNCKGKANTTLSLRRFGDVLLQTIFKNFLNSFENEWTRILQLCRPMM